MNEQYLQGYFDTYVLPSKPDADFNDWVSKISTNEQYKQGMFNSYVKPAKPDADYADWNTKIFGGVPQAPVAPQQDFLGSATQQAYSAIADMIPQNIATMQQKGASTSIKEAQQLLSNPELVASMAPEQVQALQTRIAEQQAKIPQLEQRIQTEKKEQAFHLGGITQEASEIDGARSFFSWLGGSAGQGIGQIPLSIATLGSSSFMLEAGEVYDQQLDLLAEKHGISREQVIQQGLDKPAAGKLYAALGYIRRS